VRLTPLDTIDVKGAEVLSEGVGRGWGSVRIEEGLRDGEGVADKLSEGEEIGVCVPVATMTEGC
jgi:hypothetical protein